MSLTLEEKGMLNKIPISNPNFLFPSGIRRGDYYLGSDLCAWTRVISLRTLCGIDKEAVFNRACGNDGIVKFRASRMRIILLTVSPRNEFG